MHKLLGLAMAGSWKWEGDWTTSRSPR